VRGCTVRNSAWSAAFAFCVWSASLPHSFAQGFDPPDTAYGTGANVPEPDGWRALPRVERHRAFLPVSVDLTPRMPPVGNQGTSQTCTAWAAAYAARSFYAGALEGRDLEDPASQVSPNYVFDLARGQNLCEGGTNFTSVISVLRKGALSLADYPFSPECAPPADPDVVTHATDFRVTGAHRVDPKNLDDVKGQLAKSNPVAFRFRDTTAFKRHRGSGVFQEPEFDNATATWHALTLVGYDDEKQAVRAMNSWGKGWGDKGFAWIGYDTFKARAGDAFVIDPVLPQSAVVASNAPPSNANAPALTPAVQPPNTVQPANAAAPLPQVPVIQTARRNPPDEAAPPKQLPPPVSDRPSLADLSKLSCSKVEVASQSGLNRLSGFVASEGDYERVRQIAAAVPSTQLGDIVIAPWPQCETLQTLSKALATTDRPSITAEPGTALGAGDVLRLAVTAPNYPSYLYIVYIQANGSVLSLAEPTGIVPQPTMPHRMLIFGDGREGRATFTVSPPFGREMVVALASKSPLFDKPLPPEQVERDFLTTLRRALLSKPTPNSPDREVAAAVLALRTQEKRP
jgi:hypothetical protein